MKIALAQINYTVGAIESNKMKIIDSINRARHHSVDLVIFAEQAISGTPAYDLLGKVTFLDLCEEALIEIASNCDGISALVGLPIQDGNKTISVAAHIENRRIVRYIGKMNVISRDESRHLSPSKGYEYINVAGHRLAVVMGQDLLSEFNYGDQADTIVTLYADRYARGIIPSRIDYFRMLSSRYAKNILFINQLGGQTDVVYDGSSLAFNKDGKPIALLKSFEEGFVIVDPETAPVIDIPEQDRSENVYRGIKLGLADFFRKNGYTKACLGLSGGIDSAVVLAVATEVLGPENVRVLILPSQFSSDHSVEDSKEMAESLGIEYDVVPIAEAYSAIVESLIPVVGGTAFDKTEESIQSRIRATMLMALCDKFGYVLLNTSNKSEEAVGCGVTYGDRAGAISILGDLYKIEVYDLARRINRDRIVIPEKIITKEPSSELRPDEKHTDYLPPYEVLDAILYRMIEEGQHREEIINAGFEADTVYKVYEMVRLNEQQRYQSCPVLRMSTCPFRIGRIMPLTNKYD